MLTRGLGSETAESSAADAVVTEPLLIEPIFLSGIAHAKVIRGLLYLSYFVEMPGNWDSGEPARIIKARLIMPAASVMDDRAKVDAALREHGMRVLSRAS
jgi:hypothetical protein